MNVKLENNTGIIQTMIRKNRIIELNNIKTCMQHYRRGVVAKIINNYLWPHFGPIFSPVLPRKIPMQHQNYVVLVPKDRYQ